MPYATRPLVATTTNCLLFRFGRTAAAAWPRFIDPSIGSRPRTRRGTYSAQVSQRVVYSSPSVLVALHTALPEGRRERLDLLHSAGQTFMALPVLVLCKVLDADFE